MATTLTNIRIDTQVKEEASSFLEAAAEAKSIVSDSNVKGYTNLDEPFKELDL